METTDGGIVVFKSLDISRIIHLALVTEIPALLICEIKYEWSLYGKEKNSKIKHSALSNKYENGGLKNAVFF